MKGENRTEQAMKCPVCGNEAASELLEKAGLSHQEIQFLQNHIINKTLGDVLRIAEIALRRLDPEKTGIELHVHDAVSKLRETSLAIAEKLVKEQKAFIEGVTNAGDKEKENLIKNYEEKQVATVKEFQKEISEKAKVFEQLEKQRLHEFTELKQSIGEIRDRVLGSGIGGVGEMITLLDIKKAVPEDSFSETRATKHGTDIIATVKDRGHICGNVTISVKYQQTWSGEFRTQLEKNMRQDGTRWGVLVTKAFPREALSESAWATQDDSGNTLVLVKPEYAAMAYIGLRQAAIHWFETRQVLKSRETEAEEAEKIVSILASWINGEEFDSTVRFIDTARKEAEKTRENLNQLQSYMSNKITETAKCQDAIVEHLLHARTKVTRLREFLSDSPPSSESTNYPDKNNAYNIGQQNTCRAYGGKRA